MLLLAWLLVEQQKAPSCSAASDPDSEPWTALLARAASNNDIQLACKLLRLSKGHAAAVRMQLAGQLQLQAKMASSYMRPPTLAAWLLCNGCMLQTLQVSLADEAACGMLAKAAAQMTNLRELAAYGVSGSADALLCGLSGSAGQLTWLELRMKYCSSPTSKALESLAGMAQLRELVLHKPNHICMSLTATSSALVKRAHSSAASALH